MEKLKQPQPQIDLTITKPIVDETGKPIVFAEGTIFRKGNRFILGTDKDPLIPIPILYDIESKKILLDMIPKEIRDEYKEVGFNLEPTNV
jgi:hypothetical protein